MILTNNAAVAGARFLLRIEPTSCRVYVAGRAEALDVRAAYLHELREAELRSVSIAPETVAAARESVVGLVRQIRAAHFPPRAGKHTALVVLTNESAATGKRQSLRHNDDQDNH